ncbi:MAG: DNA cytosine methyltransferase [Gemmatimonadaceae bacterium]
MNGAPKLVSLFTGAGGLDLGLEACGFETALAVEMDPDACDTLRLNRTWPVIQADINSPQASSKDILRQAGLKVGEAALLTGGPPCQPFSKSGYWAGGDSKRLNDPRASTLAAYLRVLRDIQPQAFVIENVPGIAFSAKSEGIEFLERSIDSINKEIGTRYSFRPKLLNAADYGVPQERQRVFIVGHRDGMQFKFPAKTHYAPDEHSAVSQDSHYFTAWDAIGDLESDDDESLRLSGKWADLLPSIPEGQNYLFHTMRGDGIALFGWRRRYWSFLLKLAKALPSWTIAAQPGPAIGPFHWKNRRLSATELCRLQTFPEGYKIAGRRNSIQRQLGNAVPSALAAQLGAAIRKQLLDGGECISAAALFPKRRGAPPPPEQPQSVPDKYLHLEGEHAAHPGTGKGYGALTRV